MFRISSCFIIGLIYSCSNNKPKEVINTYSKDSIIIQDLLNKTDTTIDFETSLDYNINAKEIILKQLNAKNFSEHVLNSFARYLNNSGFFASQHQPKGYEQIYYFKALGIVQRTKNFNVMASIYNNIGYFYGKNDNPDLAVFYFNHAIDNYKRAGNEKDLAYIYTNMAVATIKLKDTLETLKLYKYGLNSIKDSSQEYQHIKAAILNNIAKTYGELNKNELALEYIYQAEKIQLKLNDTYGLVIAYQNYGDILFNLNKKDSTLYYYNKGLTIANEENYDLPKQDLLAAFVRFYEKQGNAKKALEYKKQIKASNEKKEPSVKVQTDTIQLNKIKTDFVDSLFKLKSKFFEKDV
jgi:tetratricopeptide (TPR) repeat protein